MVRFKAPNSDTKKQRTGIYLERDILQGMKELASDNNRSVSYIINEEFKRILKKEGYIEGV